MTEHPLVSVIMSVYNCNAYLEQAIESIIAQTYKNWELLICDDASTDQSFAIMSAYAAKDSRLRIFRNPVNLKQLKTRNELMRLARGNFIAFQDGDDYSHVSRLEKMMKEFSENPKAGLLSTQVGFINSRNELIRVSRRPTDYPTALHLMYKDNVLGGAMVMITKQALEAVGGRFREYFDGLSYQDYDLALLVSERFEAYSLPDVLYYYRQHEHSSSKIIGIDRSVVKLVVQYLALQRKERGCDDLMEGNIQQVNAQFEMLRIPYRKDASLIFREYAAGFIFNKLHKQAVKAAWAAVSRNPRQWTNWATLQYCLRKALYYQFVRK